MTLRICYLPYFLLLLINSYSINSRAYDIFPTSSEVQINKIKHFLDQAPTGIYLTIGGERAFKAAAMFAGAEYLMICDNAEAIVKFNKINSLLLTAPDKETYRYLRWNAEFTDWQKIQPALTLEEFIWWNNNIRSLKGYTIPEELNRYGTSLYHAKFLKIYNKLERLYPFLADIFTDKKSYFEQVDWQSLAVYAHQSSISEEEYKWWHTEIHTPNSCASELLITPSVIMDLGTVIDYQRDSYLFDDIAYQRISTLAQQGKIIILNLDLNSPSSIQKLQKTIKNLNSKIAIIDFNTLYESEYMDEKWFWHIIDTLLRYGIDNSQLIVMRNYQKYSCTYCSLYISFLFENIRYQRSNLLLEQFFDNLPLESAALLDGKLYKAKDKFPEPLLKAIVDDQF